MSPETFKFLFLLCFALERLWQVFLSTLNMRWIAARSREVPDYLKGHVSLEQLRQAALYAGAKTRLGNISLLLDGFIIILLVVFGIFGLLDSSLAGVENPYLRAASFFAFLLAAQQVLETPLDYYSTFVVEERFGFNKTTLKVFWADWIKNLILSLVLAVPLILAFLWFLSSFKLWWFYSWIFFMVYSLTLTVAYPRLIAPLFNKFSPLSPGSLADEIAKLIDRCGFSLREVRVMDASRRSAHSNAYFTGFGKAKRIVLFDTLLASLKEEEMVSVLAHELGHSQKRHVLKSFFIIQILALAGFFLLDFSMGLDFIYSGLGLNKNPWSALLAFSLVLPLITFWMAPLFAWRSRRNEFEADAFAVEAVGTEGPLSTALITLGKENLSSPEPHPLYVAWHYSHPPIGERIRRMKKNKN